MPSSTVTASCGCGSRIHEPSVASLESASGPITATFVSVLLSGSAPFSLRRSTIVRWAVRRASCRCAGSLSTAATRDSSA